jgi:hypothetical protein
METTPLVLDSHPSPPPPETYIHELATTDITQPTQSSNAAAVAVALASPDLPIVRANFNYYYRRDPSSSSGDDTAEHEHEKPETTFEQKFDVRQMTVYNIRDEEDKYDLDTTGFRVYRQGSDINGLGDGDEVIKRDYYPEVERILKEV